MPTQERPHLVLGPRHAARLAVAASALRAARGIFVNAATLRTTIFRRTASFSTARSRPRVSDTLRTPSPVPVFPPRTRPSVSIQLHQVVDVLLVEALQQRPPSRARTGRIASA